jgi:hypothetical protein
VSTDTEHVRQQAADVAHSAKEAAQEQVTQVADAGRGAVRRQVDQRSTQVGEHASGVAQTLRETAFQLRSSGDAQKARYAQVAEQAADRLERTGRYLSDADADELLGRAEDAARRQPWLFAAAGLLTGVAAARFLKASSATTSGTARSMRSSPTGRRANLALLSRSATGSRSRPRAMERRGP